MIAPLALSLACFAAPQAAHRAESALDLPDPGSPTVTPVLPDGSLAALSRRLFIDEPGDGRVWARGETYKASFGTEGFTYIPFFGSDAPRAFPIRFQLVSSSVGATELSLDGPAAPRTSGDAVILDRGSVREIHHLTSRSVEQTFVFDEIARNDDLRLRIAVETDLAVFEEGGGFSFEHELGRVHYGSATAVDADGASLALEQAWTGEGFEIVVPRAFLQSAAFPLTVDPVVTTIAVSNDTRDQVDVDTAYDGQNDLYQIVYSEVENGLDLDILTVFYNANLGLLVQPSSIDITSTRWALPSTASCYQEETFMCVAVVGVFVGARQIWGRSRSAATGARGAQFQISDSGGEFADVGGFGNDTNTSFDFVVTWQQVPLPNPDFDILARGLSAGGSLIGPPTVIAGGLSNLDRRPRISKSSGRTTLTASEHRYMIVWDREESPTNRDIWARVIDFDLGLTGHAPFRAYSFSDALDADVSVQATSLYSTEPYWVMVFERLVGSDHDVFAVVARDGNADNARNVSTMQNLDVQLDQTDPKIAFDGEDYLIAYHSADSGGGKNAYFTALNVQADAGELRSALAERRDTLSRLNGTAKSVTIASQWDGGGPFLGGPMGDALALWIAQRPGGTDDEVSGAEVVEVTENAVGAQYCAANLNSSGEAAWMRATFIGNVRPVSTIQLDCQDLPPNSFGHFIVGSSSGFTANAGGSSGNLCISGSIGRYSNAVANSGALGRLSLDVSMGSIQQPFGTIASPPGTPWYFQCWTRDSAGGVPTSNFSNAIEVYVE